jgi:hypothetical protein
MRSGRNSPFSPLENEEMVLVLFAIVVFAFLLLGSTAFVLCVLLPPTRRYALSVAFWFALWGPCLVALMTLAGLGLVAGALVMRSGNMQLIDASRLFATLGWGYVTVGALITACISTGAAWLHQKVVHRFTFFLFRIYATAVSAGIGSVFGWFLGWWAAARAPIHLGFGLWVFEMFILIGMFGMGAYRGAGRLRGEAPTRFTWISPEEFAGSKEP